MGKFGFGSGKGLIPPDLVGLSLLSQKLVKRKDKKHSPTRPISSSDTTGWTLH